MFFPQNTYSLVENTVLYLVVYEKARRIIKNRSLKVKICRTIRTGWCNLSMLTLNNDCLASVTAVPDLFLEQYMPAANGEFVKVYLYLLKLVKDHQQDSTLSSMADFFSLHGKRYRPGAEILEKQGLLSLSYTTGESVPTGIAFLPLVRKEESGILPTPESSISGPIAAAPAVSAVSVEIPQTEQTRLHHHSRPFLPICLFSGR